MGRSERKRYGPVADAKIARLISEAEKTFHKRMQHIFVGKGQRDIHSEVFRLAIASDAEACQPPMGAVEGEQVLSFEADRHGTGKKVFIGNRLKHGPVILIRG